MDLSAVINELVEERGLDKETLSSIVCEGMLAAYQRRYPDMNFRISHDKKTDSILVEVEKMVVSAVTDEDSQISLRKLRSLGKEASVDEMVWLPFSGPIGRIEILRARQVIASKIRKIEADIIYGQFKDKQGSIVSGMIHKCERGGVVVKILDVLAFLPHSLTIPGEKYIVGYPLRALLKEVLPEPRNENQLILDRVSTLFVERLFELEVPEVFEGLVQIKKIARKPGYKSKIVVNSNDENIDPVGTCVGVGGVRIKPILKELGGEKIDIIAWSDSLESLIRGALKPAEINRVELFGDGVARVWLDDDQRSLAIGKMGQNIALASQLAGVEIQLVQTSKSAENETMEVHFE